MGRGLRLKFEKFAVPSIYIRIIVLCWVDLGPGNNLTDRMEAGEGQNLVGLVQQEHVDHVVAAEVGGDKVTLEQFKSKTIVNHSMQPFVYFSLGLSTLLKSSILESTIGAVG